mgnify:CR=1 FL=1
MQPIEIRPDIFWVGVNDRSTELFEGLWPIHDEGVSYNSYLIRDEKTALVDLSKENFTDDFIVQISNLIDLSQLDYVIVNHMEPDHTGTMLRLRQLAPKAVFLGMAKAVDMMRSFYQITDRVQVVKHDETLSLGKFTLRFLFTPLVHWPETMMTYVEEEQLLFSCDGFGSYGALNGGIFDDQVTDIQFYEEQALRYYSNIVAAFSRNVLRAIDTVSPHPVKIIAPSHGLVWRKDPGRILSLYLQWAKYGQEPAEPGVTVLYGTMYRNTERVMEKALQVLTEMGVPTSVFNVSNVHPSFLLPSLWTKRGVIIACPTYERAMFPAMVNALHIAEIKGVKNKAAAYFGSYAWSGGAREVFEDFAKKLDWQVAGGLEFAGSGDPQSFDHILSLTKEVARLSM